MEITQNGKRILTDNIVLGNGMSGNQPIISNSTTDGALEIDGSSVRFGGGYLILAGSSHPTQPGYAILTHGNYNAVAPASQIQFRYASNGVITTQATIDSLGKLSVIGGMSLGRVTITSVSSPYAVTAANHLILCDCTGGAITVNLPTSVGIDGTKYIIKKIDSSANLVTIVGSGAQTIDNSSTLVIGTQGTAFEITSDNANWQITAQTGNIASYGVSWNESADTYARTGTLTGIATGSSPGDVFLPIQSKMRRCVVNDVGVVQYYLNAGDSTKKADGTASVLTGADGQVMVEIPAFYYKYNYAGTTHTWEISPVPVIGFTLHPAFYKNNVYVPYRYIGAYESVLYDVSASIYTDGIYQTAVSCVFANIDKSLTIASRTGVFSLLTVGDKLVVSGTTNNNGTKTVASLVSATKITISEAVVDETAASTVVQTEANWTATTGDKLCSISGKAPINWGTRAQFRAVSANRGTGWRQEDYDLASAIQLLYLVEYASFYSQSVIGAGLTDWSSAWPGYNDFNPINNTGLSNAKGNTTFNLSNGNGVVGSYMTYRGIENWYGHLWKWVDGININNNIPYVTNNQSVFADDTSTGYTALGVTLSNADGWQSTLLQTSRGFLPASVGATSSTKITDYYWQASGWRVVLLGGHAAYGVYAGALCMAASSASGFAYRDVSGRLAY